MHGENNANDHVLTRDFLFGRLDDSTKADVIRNMKKFMKLYFSYAKSNDGIVLYVNY